MTCRLGIKQKTYIHSGILAYILIYYGAAHSPPHDSPMRRLLNLLKMAGGVALVRMSAT